MSTMAAIAEVIFGYMIGDYIQKKGKNHEMISGLFVAAVALIVTGFCWDMVFPINKKIWTVSFAIYSTGFTLFALAAFYWICDVKLYRRWATVLMIVGVNSIFIYLFHEIIGRWLLQTGLVFTGWAVSLWGPWGRALNECLVVAFQIYVCYWLYRRRIFFKL